MSQKSHDAAFLLRDGAKDAQNIIQRHTSPGRKQKQQIGGTAAHWSCLIKMRNIKSFMSYTRAEYSFIYILLFCLMPTYLVKWAHNAQLT